MADQKLTTEQEELLQKALAKLEPDQRKYYENMLDHERVLLLKMLSELSEEGESQTLEKLWEVDYIRKPPHIREFLNSPEYMGDLGLFELWKEEIIQIVESNKFEWLVGGAIGGGKTTAAVALMCYFLTHLLLLKDPQRYHDLAPGTAIRFGLFNVFKYKVEGTAWDTFSAFVSQSPFFRERYADDPRYDTALRFPNNIGVIAGAKDLHALGENLYGVIIDEANFMRRAEASGDKRVKGQAEKIYNAVRTRIESRFMDQGKVPGMLAVVSSANTEDDFLEVLMRNAVDDPLSHVTRFSRWDVRPEKYSGDTFRVLLGGRNQRPRILEDDEPVPATAEVINIPVEVRSAFVRDIYTALQDVAGVALGALRPLIPNADKILACVDDNREHPFWDESIEVDLSIDDPIQGYLNIEKLTRVENSVRVPRINPGTARFVHVDIALTGDCLGFAMGHVEKIIYTRRPTKDGNFLRVMVPVVYIDMALQITPPPDSEIDLSAVREFIFFLKDNLNYPIHKVSFDQFQSRDSMQILIKAGVESELLSMDRDDKAYSLLRQCVIEERISYYPYQPLLLELKYIEYDPDPAGKGKGNGRVVKTRRPDIMKGHYDVADSVAAVTYWCMTEDAARAGTSDDPEAETPAPSNDHKPLAVRDAGWVIGSDYDGQISPDWLQNLGGRP